MLLKYNIKTQNKLEEIFEKADFSLRYEKGSFNAGYCILENKRIIVINKYYDIEAKINCLADILQKVEIDRDTLDAEQKDLFDKIKLGKNKLF